MIGNIINSLYWDKILGNTAAGVDGSEVDGDAIDARGFDRALFILELGAVTATGKVAFNIQESANGLTFTDIAGAGFAATTATGKSDDTILIDVPVNQGYLRYQYQRSVANVEIDALQVALYGSGKIPVTQHSDVWQSITV
jgi:hypothetical protein